MIHEYLRTFDAAVRVQVIESCAQEFGDLGITIQGLIIRAVCSRESKPDSIPALA